MPNPQPSPAQGEGRCAFCDYTGPSEVLHRGADAYIIEPLNPVVPGHLLVVAYQHADDFVENGYIAGKVMETASWWLRRDGYDNCGDYNLITSKGPSATQTVPHLHIHLIPRREGDRLALPWANPDLQATEEQLKAAREALDTIHVLAKYPEDIEADLIRVSAIARSALTNSEPTGE